MPTLAFHIKLIDIDPLVTRTLNVPFESAMYVLHHIIQVVMGWKNYHLNRFEVGKLVFADMRLWEKDCKHPDYRETRVWVGSTFNPTKFSVNAGDKEFGNLNKYSKYYEKEF